MFRVWAEIWSANEAVQYGIVNLSSLRVQRILDDIGTIHLELPVQDPNAQFLAVGRIARCYTTHPYGHKRFVCAVLLLKNTLKVTSTGDNIVWQGSDRLEELRRIQTFLGRDYDGYTLAAAVTDVMALAPLWSLRLSDTEDINTSLLFNGPQLIDVLRTFADVHGFHFRLGMVDRELQFGGFGASSGIRATNLRQGNHTIDGTGDIYLFDRLDQITDSSTVVNWLIPMFGTADAYCDLQLEYTHGNSDRWTYPIQELRGGVYPYYFTFDAASIALYGESQALIFVDEIFPGGSWLNASNTLAQWAWSYLSKHSTPQVGYRIGLSKWADRLRVGDKVQVVYRGEVWQGGEKVRYADIDAALWVMKMTERYSVQGATLDLEVSNIDLALQDVAVTIANSIADQRRAVSGSRLKTISSTVTASPTVNKSTPGTLNLTFNAATKSVSNALLTITRANTTTAPDTLEILIDGVLFTGNLLNGPGAGLSTSVQLRDFFRGVANPGGLSFAITLNCLYGSGTLNLSLALSEIVLGV